MSAPLLRAIFYSLPPATKLGQGYVFTRVCDSVHRGGAWSWGVPSPGGVWSRGVSAPGGSWFWGGGSGPGGVLVEMATAAGGTHLTGNAILFSWNFPEILVKELLWGKTRVGDLVFLRLKNPWFFTYVWMDYYAKAPISLRTHVHLWYWQSFFISTCAEQIILLYFRSVTGSTIVIYLCTNTNDDSVSYEMDVFGIFVLAVQYTSKSPTGSCGPEIKCQSDARSYRSWSLNKKSRNQK